MIPISHFSFSYFRLFLSGLFARYWIGPGEDLACYIWSRLGKWELCFLFVFSCVIAELAGLGWSLFSVRFLALLYAVIGFTYLLKD
jgi:hypothetical protein